MEKIVMYENKEFGKIRTMVMPDGQVAFVGKDVCDVLGYSRARDAIQRHVDEDDAVKYGLIDSLGRTQQTTFINESGLYALILSSKLPKAREFKHWVTSEVLPQIRRTGGYIPANAGDSGQRQLMEMLRSPEGMLAASHSAGFPPMEGSRCLRMTCCSGSISWLGIRRGWWGCEVKICQHP